MWMVVLLLPVWLADGSLVSPAGPGTEEGRGWGLERLDLELSIEPDRKDLTIVGTATLRGLIRDFTGRKMTLVDVREAFVKAAPEADLRRFFEQWLDRTGAPLIEATWNDPGGPSREVEIVFTQEGPPYHLRLQFDVETSRGTSRHEVEIDGPRTAFKVPVAGDIEKVHLDPETRLLIWQPEYGPRPGA